MPTDTYLDDDVLQRADALNFSNKRSQDVWSLGFGQKVKDAVSGLESFLQPSQQPQPEQASPIEVTPKSRPSLTEQVQQTAQTLISQLPSAPPWRQQPVQDTSGVDASGGPSPAAGSAVSSAPAGASPPPAGAQPAAMPTGGKIDNTSRASFARTAYPAALQAAGGDPELAKRFIASAISENGTVGAGGDIGVGFNFGGIKYDPQASGSGNYGTWESENGQRVNQNDTFAHYNSPEEGFAAIPRFIQTNFPKAWATYQQSHDAAQLYRDINVGGYASDQDWHNVIEGINAHDVAPAIQGMPTPSNAPAPASPAAPQGKVSPVVPGASPDSYWTSEGTHGGHPAADIFAPKGTPILAPVSGTVEPMTVSAGGNAAILRGDDGRYYYLAHGDVPFKAGRAEQGAPIGQVGNTGNARGGPTHVHYAIASDPKYFDMWNGSGDISGDPSSWAAPAPVAQAQDTGGPPWQTPTPTETAATQAPSQSTSAAEDSSGSTATTAPLMLRQPLNQSPDQTPTFQDSQMEPASPPPTDASASVSDASAPGPGVPPTPAPQVIPNEDATSYGPAPQPSGQPGIVDTSGPEQGPQQPSPSIVQRIQDAGGAAKAGLTPILDAGGKVVAWVHDATEKADEVFNRPATVTDPAQREWIAGTGMNPDDLKPGGLPGALERTVRDAPQNIASLPAAHQAAVDDVAQSIIEEARATGQSVSRGEILPAIGHGLLTGLDVANIPFEIGQRDIDALLPEFVDPATGFSTGTIAANASLPRDAVHIAQSIATNAGRLAAAGVKVTPRVVSSLKSGLPVEEILQRAAGVARESAGAPERSMANVVPSEPTRFGPAMNAAALAAPGRTLAAMGPGAVAGGAAGYASSPEDASPEETAARTVLGAGGGALAATGIAGFGTLAAGRLVDSLVERGAINARVLATHPKTADRIRALFSVAADGLPDNHVVPVPDMVQAMVRMRPQIGEKVADLLSGPVTAGDVRRIVGAADAPGIGQTLTEMAVDALTGLQGRTRRGNELAADAATVRGISEEARRATTGRAASTLPVLSTPNGPARLVDPEASPNLTNFVNGVADQLGVARPGVYLSPSPVVNAAATTDGKAPALILTRGLLNADLTDNEMAAVLTHELAHTAQDSRSLVGRAFGAVRDALSPGERETAGALPGGGQPPQNPQQAMANLPAPVQQRVQAAIPRAQAQAQRTGVTAMDWIRTLGNSGVFGPVSATVNVGGAVTNAALSIPKEFIRAAVRGQPAEFMPMALASFRAFPEMFSGVVKAALASHPQAISSRGGNAVTRGLGYVAERPASVLMGAPDAFFRPMFDKQGMYRESAQVATSMGLKGQAWWQAVEDGVQMAQMARSGQAPPNPQVAGQIASAGKAYAERMLFQGDLNPGSFGAKIHDIANQDGLLGVMGNLLLPFTGTPYHMAMRTMENVPGSALSPKARGQQPTRFDTAYDQMFGSVLAGGLLYAASQGRVTGSGPSDPEKRNQMVSQGWAPHSIAIGGHFDPNDASQGTVAQGALYIPTRMLGQYQPIFDTAGEVHDALAYEKPGKEWGSMLPRLIGSRGVISNMVYLSGIANLLSMADSTDPTSGLPRFLAQTATRYTPGAGIARSVATAEDPLNRQASRTTDVGLGEATRQQAAQSVPKELGAISPVGTRQDLRPSLDVLGRPAANPQQGIAALGPKITTGEQDPVINAFEQAGIDISQPRKQITLVGTPIDLTPEEQDRYKQLRGEQLIRLVGPRAAGLGQQSLLSQRTTLNALLESANSTAEAKIQGEMQNRSQRIRDAMEAERLKKAS